MKIKDIQNAKAHDTNEQPLFRIKRTYGAMAFAELAPAELVAEMIASRKIGRSEAQTLGRTHVAIINKVLVDGNGKVVSWYDDEQDVEGPITTKPFTDGGIRIVAAFQITEQINRDKPLLQYVNDTFAEARSERARTRARLQDEAAKRVRRDEIARDNVRLCEQLFPGSEHIGSFDEKHKVSPEFMAKILAYVKAAQALNIDPFKVAS